MRPLTQYKQVQKYSSAKHKLFDAYKTWFLAMLTTCSAALAFFPECTKCRWAALAALLILPAMLAVLFYRPKLPEQQYRNNFKIKVISGDILKQNGNCVIGFTNTFDTDTVHRIISNESLQGQFQNRIYQNDVSRLDDDLSKVLNKLEPVDTIAKKRQEEGLSIRNCSANQKRRRGFLVLLGLHKNERRKRGYRKTFRTTSCLRPAVGGNSRNLKRRTSLAPPDRTWERQNPEHERRIVFTLSCILVLYPIQRVCRMRVPEYHH